MLLATFVLLAAAFPESAPAPAAGPAPRDSLPHVAAGDVIVSDADLAGWVAESVASDPRTAAESAEELFARKGRHDDLAIADAVTARLLAAGLQGFVVACLDGQVTLRGRCDSDRRRARAGRLAAEVTGVEGVDNGLRVAGEPSAPAAQAAGAAPAVAGSARQTAGPAAGPAAGAASSAAPVLAPARFPARSDTIARTEPFSFLTSDALAGRGLVVEVAGGVVHLTGLVNSDAARLYASAAAQRVPGVRAVTSALAVRPHDAEDDRRLALLVQRRMENCALLRDVVGSIGVSALDGVILLTGSVRDGLQLAEAEGLASSTQAAFAVESALAVDPDVRLADSVPAPRAFRLMKPW